jgi:hypothetical protein
MVICWYANACAAQRSIDKPSEAESVIEAYVKSIDSNDWEKFLQFSTQADKAERVAFFTDKSNAMNKVGLLGIKKAELALVESIEYADLSKYTDMQYYANLYGSEIQGYFVGINIEIEKESKYFYNGVNYFIFILAKEDNEWKEIEFSQAPITLVKKFAGDDKTSQKIIAERFHGNIISSNGSILETNIASEKQLAEERGELISTAQPTSVGSEFDRPSEIRVRRVALDKTEIVDFYDYVKNVLPNEWIASWRAESLKAGAQACKFVGWYRVYHAKYPNYDYDVKDTTADQVYTPNTENSDTTAAINAVGGIGIKNSEGTLFYPAYAAGSSGSNGTQYGGQMSQWGSQRLAGPSYNYTCMDILHYYYDYSDKSEDEIETFSY